MHACPFCKQPFHVRALPHQSWWKNDRLCPHCGGKITVDRDTKIRQMLFLLLALISLAFTAMLQFDGNHWLLPALASYLVMWLGLYWATKQVFFLPYKSLDQASAEKTQSAGKRHRLRSMGNWAVILGSLGLLGVLQGLIQFWTEHQVDIRPGKTPVNGDESLILLLGLTLTSVCFISLGLLLRYRARSKQGNHRSSRD